MPAVTGCARVIFKNFEINRNDLARIDAIGVAYAWLYAPLAAPMTGFGVSGSF
jgi:hypothetical protein